MKRVRLGRIYGHALTFAAALDEVAELVARGNGGYVVTPNVDHVVQAEHSEELRAAYEGASLSLVDGQPLIWLAKLMGEPFPENASEAERRWTSSQRLPPEARVLEEPQTGGR